MTTTKAQHEAEHEGAAAGTLAALFGGGRGAGAPVGAALMEWTEGCGCERCMAYDTEVGVVAIPTDYIPRALARLAWRQHRDQGVGKPDGPAHQPAGARHRNG